MSTSTHHRPTVELTPELRAKLADYVMLDWHDTQRLIRYGDMARYRRQRELFRLGDELIAAGLRISVAEARSADECVFPAADDLTPAELRAAFERTLRPRLDRIRREDYRTGTAYSRASIAALNAVDLRIAEREVIASTENAVIA